MISFVIGKDMELAIVVWYKKVIYYFEEMN